MDFLSEVGARTSPIPQLEEEIYRLRDNQREYSITRVEDHDISQSYEFSPDGGKVPGSLVYFLDTYQRTQLVGHFITPLGLQVPVHYSIIMTLILERRNRRFKVWGAPRLKHLVLLPFAFLEDRAPVEKRHEDVEIVDTGIDQPDYTQIRVQSIQVAFAELERMKIDLISDWSSATEKEQDEYLLHHGSFLENPNASLDKRVIGWSKTVYLPYAGAKEADIKHLKLDSLTRTAVSRIERESDAGASLKYAWFIKLRSHVRHGPEFGLVKPEVIADSDTQAIECAEWMTYVLLKERQPATFPALHWDKLIFPIKLCRTYLEGIVPTRETIRSFFDRS